MRRRALLGTLASLAVAGCTGTGPRATDTETTRTTTTTTTPTASTSSSTTTTSAATPPELRTLGVPATQSGCPLGDEGRAVCYPEQPDANLSLSPAADELDLPTDSTTFTLANDTDYEYRTNFYGWSLEKHVDGEWFHVAPQFWHQPLHVLPAGDSHEWSFTVDNGQSPTGVDADDEEITLAGLGGGEYAFTADGWFPFGEGEMFRVSLGARFRLNGDQVALTPAEDVSASRDGDTVVVTTDEEPAENEEPTACIVERSAVPAGQSAQRYITEQLLRPSPGLAVRPLLRDTIPFFEDGVQTVRLEAPDGTSPPFGVDEPEYVRYEGETYKISTKRLG